MSSPQHQLNEIVGVLRPIQQSAAKIVKALNTNMDAPETATLVHSTGQTDVIEPLAAFTATADKYADALAAAAINPAIKDACQSVMRLARTAPKPARTLVLVRIFQTMVRRGNTSGDDDAVRALASLLLVSTMARVKFDVAGCDDEEPDAVAAWEALEGQVDAVADGVAGLDVGSKHALAALRWAGILVQTMMSLEYGLYGEETDHPSLANSPSFSKPLVPLFKKLASLWKKIEEAEEGGEVAAEKTAEAPEAAAAEAPAPAAETPAPAPEAPAPAAPMAPEAVPASTTEAGAEKAAA